MPKRVTWAAVAAAVVVAVVVLVRPAEPELIPLGPAGGVTIAGDLAVEPASPAAGGAVEVRATISADRPVTLSRLVVRVRDEAGAPHDFPVLTEVSLDTSPKALATSRRFPAPGEYTYYLAYELAGRWVDLPPWQRLRVR